jgi:hypothetical protein
MMTKIFRQTTLEEFEGFCEIVKVEFENQKRVRELYGKFNQEKENDK